MNVPSRTVAAAPTASATPSFSPASAVASSLLVLIASALLALRLKRRRTYLRLSSGCCGLPTVLWRPKFVDYSLERDEADYDDGDVVVGGPKNAETQRGERKKMASSSITGILPRMERLGGPYGMYGTVYGLSTAVVHVAHPVPARLVLTGEGESGDGAGDRGSGRASSFRDSFRDLLKSIGGGGAGSLPSGSRPGERLRRSSSVRSSASSCGASKSPAYDHFKNFSGDGVFTADGDEWKAKRASLIHCLLRGCTSDKSEGSKRLEREANRAASGFAAQVERERRARRHRGGTSAGDERVNVVPLLQRSTVGLIYRFITHHDVDIFGDHAADRCAEKVGAAGPPKESDPDAPAPATPRNSASSSSTSLSSLSTAASNDHEDKKPVRRTDGGVPREDNACVHTSSAKASAPSSPTSSLLSLYMDSVTNIRMIILAQSRSIWFLVPRWVYRTFSPLYRREERCMGPIREFARSACVNAREGSPLAQLRLRTTHGGSGARSSSSGPNGKEKREEEVSKDLLDEAITLLFAGQDTSAATLSWTLHLLGLYPDVQRKVAEEVRRVLDEREGEGADGQDGGGEAGENGAAADGKFVTKRLASRMTYLDAVIKESMRLYPVAPFVVRRLPRDVSVPAPSKTAGPTVLPGGTLVCVWIYGLHRNPSLWDRPDAFLPERWIDLQLRSRDEARQGGAHGSAFLPFAAGPRNCIGRPLAQVVLRILLARIMAEYEVVDKRVERRSQDASEEEEKKEEESSATTADPIMSLRKDMQAGFTVLPSGGVRVSLRRRCASSMAH